MKTLATVGVVIEHGDTEKFSALGYGNLNAETERFRHLIWEF
ncbi:MAG: hypothetical protein ACPGVB_06040 [Chitinophagales bacterium]